MRSNTLLFPFITLAISAAAIPLDREGWQDAGALSRRFQPRHNQAKGDYHPLPRDVSDTSSGDSLLQQSRRAADDIDLTKVVDLNNNGNKSNGQGGSPHTNGGAGGGPSTWQLNEAIQSANKGDGTTKLNAVCPSQGGPEKGQGPDQVPRAITRALEAHVELIERRCAADPSTATLQAMRPEDQGQPGQPDQLGQPGQMGLPGHQGLPTKAHDTLPGAGSALDSSSGDGPDGKGAPVGSGGKSTDTASPDATKQDNSTSTPPPATTPTPAPAPSTPAPAPAVGVPLPMNLLASALIDIIKAFEKATTPVNTTTSLAALPTPAPTPTPTSTPTPNTADDNKSSDGDSADTKTADANSPDAKSPDSSSPDSTSPDSNSPDAAGSRRGLSEAEGVDGPFKWIVMRGNGAEEPDAALTKRSSTAAEEFEVAKRRILDTFTK